EHGALPAVGGYVFRGAADDEAEHGLRHELPCGSVYIGELDSLAGSDDPLSALESHEELRRRIGANRVRGGGDHNLSPPRHRSEQPHPLEWQRSRSAIDFQ